MNKDVQSEQIPCDLCYPNVARLSSLVVWSDHVWVDDSTDHSCDVKIECHFLQRIADLRHRAKQKIDDVGWSSKSKAFHPARLRRQWLNCQKWTFSSISSNSTLHDDACARIQPHVETLEEYVGLEQPLRRCYCYSEPAEVWLLWCNVYRLVPTIRDRQTIIVPVGASPLWHALNFCRD